MAEVLVDIPQWQLDILILRARALDLGLSGALVLSLGIETPNALEETVRFAVQHGASIAQISDRLHVSETTARDAKGRAGAGAPATELHP